ncbi:IS630 family transposase [Paracoccaceae bacterium]|nr:IS630 family transposase [Paracoccaceae bacterium]
MTGKSLSLDLPECVVSLVETGHSCHEASRRLCISAASAVRIMQRRRRTDSIAPALQGRPRQSKLDVVSDFLKGQIDAAPDIAMSKLATVLFERHTIRATPAMLSCHLIHRFNYAYKKSLIATERRCEQVRAARYEWMQQRQPRMRLEPHRLIFIDETAVTAKMTRLRGRSLGGARLETNAPFGHWRTLTFITGLRVDELAAHWMLDGPMNRAAFETYIKTQLVTCLQPAEVVIADNLSSHKSTVAQAFLKAQVHWLLFLQPYSPDLNPIEMGFSKLKALLRRMKARNFDTLFKSVAQACKLFPRQECQNYFKAAGFLHIKWIAL